MHLGPVHCVSVPLHAVASLTPGLGQQGHCFAIFHLRWGQQDHCYASSHHGWGQQQAGSSGLFHLLEQKRDQKVDGAWGATGCLPKSVERPLMPHWPFWVSYGLCDFCSLADHGPRVQEVDEMVRKKACRIHSECHRSMPLWLMSPLCPLLLDPPFLSSSGTQFIITWAVLPHSFFPGRA